MKGEAVRMASAIRRNSGFTLIETILASVILCGSVLALGALSTRALGAMKLNRQYETAKSLADKQLTLIDYMGIDAFLDAGRTEGVFEQFEPGYHWEVTSQYEEIDSLYLVNITVSWVERNRLYEVSAETRFNGISEAVEIVEPAEESGAGQR